jgi:hypothetical protein
MKLKIKSQKFKKQADALLKKTKLLSILKKYGKVEITGSYDLDLLLSGDVDIHVLNPKITREKALKALIELIAKTNLKGYSFFDWVKFRKGIFPKGYYVGLKTEINGVKWKIDIWFIIERVVKQELLMNELKNKLDEKSRNLILASKEYKQKNNINISSTEIYRAVLNSKIGQPRDLENLI